MTDGEIKALFKGADDENKRQNQRIEKLEVSMSQLNTFAVALERMATSMEHMTQEIQTQGQRIASLEKKPSDLLDKIVMCVITAIVGGLIGHFFV